MECRAWLTSAPVCKGLQTSGMLWGCNNRLNDVSDNPDVCTALPCSPGEPCHLRLCCVHITLCRAQILPWARLCCPVHMLLLPCAPVSLVKSQPFWEGIWVSYLWVQKQETATAFPWAHHRRLCAPVWKQGRSGLEFGIELTCKRCYCCKHRLLCS